MIVAAIQMNAVLADVKANLIRAERLIQEASNSKAELVLLPEFFTSGMGYSEKMLDVAVADNQVQDLMCKWANEYGLIIGGSYISLENSSAYNLFQLAFPNGNTYCHRKDLPTQLENCYYTEGDVNNVLITPIGNIGVALCWEMIRYDTVKRMAGKVDFVLAGSCWWDLPEDAAIEREPLRRYNQKLAKETPIKFAKLVKAPVIHSNHCGRVTAYNFPKADREQTRQFVGAAQIIDRFGSVIERREFYEGEGIVTADIECAATGIGSEMAYPEKYWIPNLPDSYINAWETINPLAKKYYTEIAFQHYKNYY